MRLLLALALALGLVPCLACQRVPAAVLVQPDARSLRYTGWFDTRVARAPRCAWAGSQIAAKFTGTSLRIRLVDTPVEDEIRETDWMTVVVDDAPPRTFALAEGEHVYPIASALAAGSHRVVIWKRTEPEVGTMTFLGMSLDPGAVLLPLRAPARRMIFVGDSITAGYGDEGADGNCHWSAALENNYASYGAVAARELAAEYVAMAWSGKGITRNYETRDLLTLPAVYERVIPTEDDSPRIGPLHADVVVVNAGTNDFFRGVPDEPAFEAAYHELLAALRARYPDALFVLGVGPMLADDYPQPKARSLTRAWVESVRARRQAEGDDRLESLELWFDPSEGVGCDFHPNLRTHARLGHELAELVRAKLGW